MNIFISFGENGIGFEKKYMPDVIFDTDSMYLFNISLDVVLR